MIEEYVEPQDASSSWNWPVRWEPAVRLAVAGGLQPDVLLDDPRLVAHRTLDRLAALAFEVHHGAPGATDAFVDAIRELILVAPWLVSAGDRRDTGAAKAHSVHDTYGAHSGASATESVPPLSEDDLIDGGGVSTLLAVAAGLAGRDGATAILELAATAMAAEHWLPGLSHSGDARYRIDVALLGGTPVTGWQQWLPPGSLGGSGSVQPAGERAPALAPVLIDHPPLWQRLNALAHSDAATVRQMRCLRLFHELTDNVMDNFLPPQPDGPVTWTTGIEHVEVTDPCGASPLLTIHGQGFGAAAPSGFGVVAARWDEDSTTIFYRPVPVVSWSETQVVVQLGSSAVGGQVAFANVAFIGIYDSWADDQNQYVATTMHAAGCPGYGPPASPKIWSHWSETPAYAPAATYEAGMPHIVAEITLDPVGKAPALWNNNTVHLETGQTFWVLWKTANADSAVLRASGPASQILVAAGYPASGVTGTSGSVKLVAPSQPAVVEFTVEASNAACGTAQAPLRLVITGPALQPVTIEVQQSLPGGNVSVLVVNGVESLNPAAGQSIPLVAQKRSVARIDWWTAFPQVPVAELLTAEASLHVSGSAIPWPGVTLRPGTSTANPPPTPSDPPVTLQSGRPFSSVLEYQQWIAQNINNNPATFNVVLPGELCVGQVTLEATVRARNQNGRLWTETVTRTVDFHQRRRVRIRYRRHSNPGNPAPTTQAAVAALRDACSMLPIPDPQILVLGNDPAVPSMGYIEDMMDERSGFVPGSGGPWTPTPSWRDEIWLVVGPAGVGGVANSITWPWTAATDATALITAHEIGHLFSQRHIALCGAEQNPEQPTAFPDQGAVVVTGWDMWNNRLVRNTVSGQGAVVDVMTYCWARMWITPERWRRIFLQVGP